MLEIARDTIYVYQFLPRRKIEYINGAIAHLTGYKPEEFYADPDLIFTIVHPDDREQFQRGLYQSGERDSSFILRWLHRNGKVIRMEQYNTPIYDDRGSLIAVEGIVRKINDNSLARYIQHQRGNPRTTKQRGANRGRIFSRLVGSFPIACKRQGNSSKLKLPFWTGAIVTASVVVLVESLRQLRIIVPVPFLLIGVPVLLSCNFGGLRAGICSAAVWTIYVIYAAALSFGPVTLTGGPLQLALGTLIVFWLTAMQGRRKDRNEQLTQALQAAQENLEKRIEQRTASLAQANAMLRQEINERKQAEASLEESERRFRAIFNQTFQFIGLLTPEGILLEVNQTALDFGGIELAEVIGKPFWQACWWTISSATQKQLREAIDQARAGEFVRYEVDILGAGDAVISIDFSIKPVRDKTGQVVLLIPEGRDITDRKQAEKALQQINDRLNSKVKELEQRQREIILLSDTINFLQVCLTLEEAYTAIETLIQPLFPDSCGAIFIIDTSNNLVEAVTTWGEAFNSETLFAANQCWALRRGRPHWLEDARS